MEGHSAETTTTAAKVSRIGSSSNRTVSGGGSSSSATEETSADANSGSEMTRFGTGRHQHHRPHLHPHSHSNTAMRQMQCSSSLLGHHHPIQRLCNSSPVRHPRFASSSRSVATKLFHAAVLCLLFVFSSDLVGSGNQVLLPRVAAGSVSGGFSLNSSGIDGASPGSEGSQRSGQYTAMWAVDIPGGIEVADDVARHHGFINHGRVSGAQL